MSKTALILFGATGDLAREKLFPALSSLLERGKFLQDTTILAIGRREYDNQAFANHIQDTQMYSPTFLEKIEYVQMNFLEQEPYADLGQRVAEFDNLLFYLAVPPNSYEAILRAIAASGVYREHERGWSRIVIEKPFGHDQKSAQYLNELVCSLFHEENTYRIDHYLGKDTVENILAFRFSNPLFEAVWNSHHIDHIQITSAESAGLRNRAAFYAEVGATRDIFQNHLMQLVTLLTMEAPTNLGFDALAEAKMGVLTQMKVDKESTVFAQFGDEGIEQAIGTTETYLMTALEIDTPRWKGVPIYVRTGKRLAEKVTEVSVVFKQMQHALFSSEHQQTNVVTFRIQPNEGIFVRFAVKEPGERHRVNEAHMIFCYETQGKLADAYENLFESVFQGIHAIALRSDVIEESWRVADTILAMKPELPLLTYKPESWGPPEADSLLEREGRFWRVEDHNVCNGVTLL